MRFHIVSMGETMERIMALYELNQDELIAENKHIKVWNKLVPGTKLRIPTITETIEQDIKEMEPFIEDYYPVIKKEEDIPVLEEETKEEPAVDIKEEKNIAEDDEEDEEEYEEDIYQGYQGYPFYYPYYNGEYLGYPPYPNMPRYIDEEEDSEEEEEYEEE